MQAAAPMRSSGFPFAAKRARMSRSDWLVCSTLSLDAAFFAFLTVLPIRGLFDAVERTCNRPLTTDCGAATFADFMAPIKLAVRHLIPSRTAASSRARYRFPRILGTCFITPHLDHGYPALSDPSPSRAIRGDDTKYIGHEAKLQSGSRRQLSCHLRP